MSRANPRPGSPKSGPRAQRDPAALEEDLGRIVAEPELAAVEPGEIAGLRRQVAHLRQVLGEQLRERAPVAVEVREERVEPLAAVLERGERRRERRSGRRGSGRCFGQRSADEPLVHLVGGRDDHRALQPGDVAAFEAERDHDAVRGGLLAEREVGEVDGAPGIVIGAWTSSEITVDPVLGGERRRPPRAPPRAKRRPGRVVRVAEQVDARAPPANARLEPVEVEPPAVRARRAAAPRRPAAPIVLVTLKNGG